MTLKFEYDNQDKFVKVFTEDGFESTFDSEHLSKFEVQQMLFVISQNEELVDLEYPKWYIDLKTNHPETNAFFEVNSDTNSINFIFIIDGEGIDFQTCFSKKFPWNPENRITLINLLREIIDDCYDDTIEVEEEP